MKKVSLNVWVQLIGLLSVLGGLIFVGLEMRQSQQIALAAQQQARSEVLIDMINTFSEGSEKFHTTIKAFGEGLYLENDILSSNSVYQFWLLYENDFLQYQIGLMDEEIWQAKLAAMRRTYNACQFRPETDLMFNFVSAELSTFIIETTEDECSE
jgi:hypothetical protein